MEIQTQTLFYHTPNRVFRGVQLPRVTVCAIVQLPVGSNTAVINFGFAKCGINDHFSKKIGRELSQLRAEKAPTVTVGFKDFKQASFVSIAERFGEEVVFGTQFGSSLLANEIKLPKEEPVVKTKRRFTQEEIDSLRQQSLANKENATIIN